MYTYIKTVMITSSHFNGEEQYKWWKIAQDATLLDERFSAYEKCVINSHGHNFFITVEVFRHELDRSGFVIDDEGLEALIREWDRTNLSVHKDFLGSRATTELMASALAEKISLKFEGLSSIKVTVQETPDIVATHLFYPQDELMSQVQQ